MPFGLRYVIGYGACTAPPENASQFRRIREAKVPKAVAPMLRPWYWPMKLRIRGRPLASIACVTAPSAAPVPESSKNTRLRFFEARISTGGLPHFSAIPARNAAPIIDPLGGSLRDPQGTGTELRLQGRLEEFAKRRGNRFRFLRIVVVRDQDALRAGEDPGAALLLDLVAQRERRRTNLRGPHGHLNLVAPYGLGLEVDLHVGQNEIDLVERALARLMHIELRPRELDVGQVDGVVHMAHSVDVAEPHLDVRGETRPPRPMRDPPNNVSVGSLPPNQASEFFRHVENGLLRRVPFDRPPRREARLREFAVERPRQFDAPLQGLVDFTDRLGRDARNQAPRRKLGRLPYDSAARDKRSRADRRAAVDRRVHPDQAAVGDRATVDDGRMAHRDLRADSRRHAAVHVHDDVVLKVRVSADNDLVEITAQHGSVPDARPVLDRHVSDEDRARCDVNHPLTRGSRGRSLRGCRTGPRRPLALARGRTASTRGTAFPGRCPGPR